MKDNYLTTGLPENKVRDPSFRSTDEKRAAEALLKVYKASEAGLGQFGFITLNEEECTDIIAMLQSQEYFKTICNRADELNKE